MITHKNQLSVCEVSCYSRQEIEGGVIIRYMIRNPEEVEWRAVKVFRPTEHDQDSRDRAESAAHDRSNA